MQCQPTDLAAWLQGAAHVVTLATAVVILTAKRRPMRTTLESGAWIEHVPAQDLKGKHIRTMQRVAKLKMSRDDVDEDGEVDVGGLVERMDLADMDEARHDALWALLIETWSFEFPVPALDRSTGEVTGAEVLDEINADDYEEIDKILAPHAKKLRNKPNPKSSTTSGSSGPSRARANGSRRG